MFVRNLFWVGSSLLLSACAKATPSPMARDGRVDVGVYEDASGKLDVGVFAAVPVSTFAPVGRTEHFGSGLALSTDEQMLVVGDSHAYGHGSVFVYEKKESAWVWMQTIYGSETTVHFGESLALTDDAMTLIVGSGDSTRGVALYQRRGRMFEFQRFLSSPGRSPSFGEELSLSRDGKTLAVSEGTGVEETARVRIFKRPASSWSLSSTIDVEPNESIALGLSTDGRFLLIGSRLYEDQNGSWMMRQEMSRLVEGSTLRAEDNLLLMSSGNDVLVYARDAEQPSFEQRQSLPNAVSPSLGNAIHLSSDGRTLITAGCQGEQVFGQLCFYSRL